MRVSFGECVVALLLVLVLTAVAGAHKRAESESGIVSPVPFVMGSRYGRSSERLITPRNDRSATFFMGSRYGKRSETVPSNEQLENDPSLTEKDGIEDNTPHPHVPSAEGREILRLYCEYTGVLSLYRCRPRKPLTPAIFSRNIVDDSTQREDE